MRAANGALLFDNDIIKMRYLPFGTCILLTASSVFDSRKLHKRKPHLRRAGLHQVQFLKVMTSRPNYEFAVGIFVIVWG